uniref:Dinitrogenase iron-molybdenum cofactor biosynthesis protein n=1 Tax=Desulfomonile tiedjei TaxID=2358 RepID=A0A7C4ESN7_9BACT
MPDKKVLIPLSGDDVAPRFDLAPEVVVVTLDDDGAVLDERAIVLPSASAEILCRLILDEKTDVVVCGGIDDEYFQYLTWKKVKVIDSVIGRYDEVLRRLAAHALAPGDVIRPDQTSKTEISSRD